MISRLSQQEINTLKLIEETSADTWKHYAGKTFAMAIACQAPKVDFKNDLLNQTWKKHSLINDFTKKNFEIVRLASIFGSVCVGLSIQPDLNDNPTPCFNIGIPLIKYKTGNRLARLKLVVDTLKRNGKPFFVIEDWNITDSFRTRYISDLYGDVYDLEDLDYADFDNIEGNNLSEIPYVEFFANPWEEPDLAKIDPLLFRGYQTNLQLLINDSKLSKSIAKISGFSGTPEAVQVVKKAYENDKTFIIDNGPAATLFDQNEVNVMGGTSNFESLLAKQVYYKKEIKSFGFMRLDSTDLGSNQKNSDEISVLNSNAENNIQLKADLMEQSWYKFLTGIYTCYLQNYENITEDTSQVDIEVVNSKKYLQNIENKHVITHQGLETNPNDLNNKDSQDDDNFKTTTNQEKREVLN